ncbi:hypothetical protein Q3H58_001520 [Pseudomonas psychrotolerans]|nr:hypothetical protein [Pseudomonas psychrotolerans]
MDGRGAEHRAEHEGASRLAILHRAARLVGQGEQPMGVVQQAMPGSGQVQPLALAQEQLHAELFLQLAQARGEIGRYPVEPFGGPYQGALFGHCLENS